MTYENMSIRELLIQYKHHGDAEACGVLYARLHGTFYRKAVSKGDRGGYGLSHEDAEDAIQETFASVHTHNFDGGIGGGPAWLWQIFGNNVINILRKNRVQYEKCVSLEMLIENVQHDIVISEVEGLDPLQIVLDNEFTQARTALWERVWEKELTREEREAIAKGPGRGGTKKQPGSAKYWIAFKSAVALYEKYYEEYFGPNNKPEES